LARFICGPWDYPHWYHGPVVCVACRCCLSWSSTPSLFVPHMKGSFLENSLWTVFNDWSIIVQTRFNDADWPCLNTAECRTRSNHRE
jgi:hypothetical protein